LTPKIGYEEAARIAKKAYLQNKTIREVVGGERLFSTQELNRLLDPRSMIAPAKPNKKKI
jgi:fumarate hydratase class II